MALARCHAPRPGPVFPAGCTPVVQVAARRTDPAGMGMDFAVLRLPAGAAHRERTGRETVFVLLDGGVAGRVGDTAVRASRRSLFDEAPTAFQLPVLTWFKGLRGDLRLVDDELAAHVEIDMAESAVP